MSLLLKKEESTYSYALWRMEESASALAAMLPSAMDCPSVAESRRREFYAIRVLIRQFGIDPGVLAHYPSGRPFLQDSDWHLSLSHCRDYAVVLLSREYRHIGVDIEAVSERMLTVSPRFLQEREQAQIEALASDRAGHLRLLGCYWSGKEAMFKALCDEPETYLQDLYIETSPEAYSQVLSLQGSAQTEQANWQQGLGADLELKGHYRQQTFHLSYRLWAGHVLCFCRGRD